MIKLYDTGVFLANGREIIPDNADSGKKLSSIGKAVSKEDASQNTIAYSILKGHNTSGNMDRLKIKFDSMASHDITYVGIIQTARASGLTQFPIPYVLTNCHNSLCAVGGTINDDDHLFGLSAAKKYGGIFVPTNFAVIHQYMREMMCSGGKMILGSDSHTRYGALGTIAIGEGGGELAKQLLGKTYDINRPEVIAVYLTGKPQPGVGPQDISLAIIGAVFEKGYVKNKIMEFIGDGIANLNVDYRNGIDVMTTETTCLSSVWETDGQVKDYFEIHGRPDAYKELKPGDVAYYDGMVYVDMSKIEPMIAMPFHPSNVYSIRELNENISDIINIVETKANAQIENPDLRISLKDKIKNNRLIADQGIIVGCSGGTFDNICDAADIMDGKSIGDGYFGMTVYAASQPVYMELLNNGTVTTLMKSGAVMKPAFCGPCFGAGDVPATNSFSIRHVTRNFPNREGSVPAKGQVVSVAIMDARSIAATAVNGGVITPATDLVDVNYKKPKYYFDKSIYEQRVYNGFDKPMEDEKLILGPNIADWPQMPELAANLLLRAASIIHDPVTTTDELIPSGETSAYRSNPLGLAEFTLSRKDPKYVSRAKYIQRAELLRLEGVDPSEAFPEVAAAFDTIGRMFDANYINTGIGSFVYAVKPGDGSAREQAASCQKVLGGYANIAKEYATKRYRSNLMNWGMLPFLHDGEVLFDINDFIFIPNIRKAIMDKLPEVLAYVVKDGVMKEFTLKISEMTDDERRIILAGCIINYYKN